MRELVKKIYIFYRDGFRNMRLGRRLWTIIIIKLLILFGFIKLFFFPDFLATNFVNDEQRAEHVLENITRLPQNTHGRR